MDAVWEDTRNVTSAFQGITTPLSDLYNEIHTRGWQVTGVKIRDGQYEATATNPQGETAAKLGRDEKTALGALLLYIVRREYIRQGSWNRHWGDQLEPIAQAYAKAPTFDPMAAAAWKELADDCVARAEQLKQQLQVEVTDDPTPYHSPQELWEDVTKHKRLMVSRAASEHPVWTPEQVLAFRIVHDVLGHAAAGGDFGWTGENLATAAHMPYLSPNAQRALFTETVGQKAYNHYYHGFGYPKITFLDDHLKDIQQGENPPGHGGLPVPYTLSPGVLPERTANAPRVVEGDMINTNWGSGPPDRQPVIYHHPTNTLYVGAFGASHGNLHDQFHDQIGPEYDMQSPHISYGGYYPEEKYTCPYLRRDIEFNNALRTLAPVMGEDYVQPPLHGDVWSRTAGLKRDPNFEYQTGIAPAVDVPGQYGDPLNYHALKDMGHMLNTGWASWTNPQNGQPDLNRMKQALVNAFRVALLSPMKELKWNAAHYQDISHIPYSVTDPKVYWDALENARIEYNRVQGIPDPEIQHKEHYRSGALLDFYRYYQAHHPEMDVAQAKEEADREVMVLRSEIEEKLMEEAKDPDADLLEPKIDKELNKALKQIVSDDQPLHKRGEVENPYQPQKVDRYGGFIARHLVAISRVSLYADQLLESALEDVKRHDGAGHMFRAMALSLDIPYVGPKVASFAWLLLQPLTSQLAAIDTHMGDVLGYNLQKTPPPTRDYFRMERELQAGRDAIGYSHMPLGLFQWGMWDIRRHGHAEDHQDHSALKAWNPTPWQTIPWQPVVKSLKQNKGQWEPPEWWSITEPYRDAEKAAWNTDVAPFTPASQIPWTDQPVRVPPITASSNELHIAVGVPENVRKQIAEWIGTVDLDGLEFLEPKDYHITVAYASSGMDAPGIESLHTRFNFSGIPFEAKRISTFDGGAVVIELKSRYFKEYVRPLHTWLEEQGVEIERYPSGIKPHITIGYTDGSVPSLKVPPLSFRCEALYVSKPLGVEDTHPILARKHFCPKCQSNLDVKGVCVNCGWSAVGEPKRAAIAKTLQATEERQYQAKPKFWSKVKEKFKKPVWESEPEPVVEPDLPKEKKTKEKTAGIKLAQEHVFYHVAPAAARESIAMHGLHPRHRIKSPWSDLNRQREDFPEGNFLWEHPDNARSYSHVLADKLVMPEKRVNPSWGGYRGPDYNAALERLRDEYNLVDDGLGNVYKYKWPEEEDDGPEETDYDHETDRHDLNPEDQGWDIWQVRVPERHVKPDPEPVFRDGRLDPNQLIPHKEFIQNPGAYGYPEDGDEMRWYMPNDVTPEQLQHFEHLPLVSVLKAKALMNEPGNYGQHPLDPEALMGDTQEVPEQITRVQWPHYEAYRQFMASEPYARWGEEPPTPVPEPTPEPQPPIVPPPAPVQEDDRTSKQIERLAEILAEQAQREPQVVQAPTPPTPEPRNLVVKRDRDGRISAIEQGDTLNSGAARRLIVRRDSDGRIASIEESRD